VAFDGTNFLVVWTDDSNDYEVKGRFVSPAGTLGTELSINASTAPSDNPLTVAFDGTNYLVVWTDEVGATVGVPTHAWDVFGQRVDTSGNLVGGVISISTAAGQQFLPMIAFDGANYLVTWTDMRNDTNKDWVCDSNEGTCSDIYGQYVSKTGAVVGTEFVINNDTGNQMGGVGGFAGGKYFVIVNTGIVWPGPNYVPDWSYGDVYGVFVTPTDTSNTGTVTGTVTYVGSLGPVSASKPILVVLSPFLNGLDEGFAVFAINGTFKQMVTLTTSPSTFTFTNVPPGQYHLVAILDIDNNGPTDPNPAVVGDGDPVEIYTPGNEAGSNFHADPNTVFTVTAGQTYSLAPSLTFADAMRVGD